jgi:hypothetical protein
MFSGAQIPAAVVRATKFCAVARNICVGPLYGICFVSLSWHVEF